MQQQWQQQQLLLPQLLPLLLLLPLQPQKQIKRQARSLARPNSICNLQPVLSWVNNFEWNVQAVEGIARGVRYWFAISWQPQFAPHHRSLSASLSICLCLAGHGWWSFWRIVQSARAAQAQRLLAAGGTCSDGGTSAAAAAAAGTLRMSQIVKAQFLYRRGTRKCLKMFENLQR